VSIDAMYWVWNHSRSKGTGRHVMLAVANRITGTDGTARVSTAELVRFSNAARSSVITAIDALVKSGELHLLEEGRGTRAALYKIPGSVDYARPDSIARGPKTGPLDETEGSGSWTSSASQGSENRTPPQNARGPKAGPQGSENRTPRGPKTGPHNHNHLNHEEEASSSPWDDPRISAEDKVEFGNFWQLFPKSQDPTRTRDAWAVEVLNGAAPKQITAAAVAYARDKASEPWRFVKSSANWLTEQRYLDKHAPTPDGKPGLKAVKGTGHQPFVPPPASEYQKKGFAK
jgi:hypothetical protein